MRSYTDPDSLADALIEAGCKEVERADVAAHGHLARGSAGSEAQVRHVGLNSIIPHAPTARRIVQVALHAMPCCAMPNLHCLPTAMAPAWQ